MERDIRSTALYREVEQHFKRVHEPAFGSISGAAEPAPSPDGRSIAFTGSCLASLEGSPSSRICLVGTEGGPMEEITSGPNDDKSPRWSPDGATLAFLSDRGEKGTFRLYLLRSGRLGEAQAAPDVAGTAEYFDWSPDGSTILLGAAGKGADLAGVQGSGVIRDVAADVPSWMPAVESGEPEDRWRRLHLYDVSAGTMRPASRDGLNVWEATWVGLHRIAAIVSDAPTEDAWYRSCLGLIDPATGEETVLYRGDWQLGLPAASPSGRRLAVVEALCSDRGVIAGDVVLVDPVNGAVTRVDTGGVDVTGCVWRDEERLLYAGMRGLHAVVGEYNAATKKGRDLWETAESIGGRQPDAAPIGTSGFAAVLESYTRHPEVVTVEGGEVRQLTSLSHAGAEYVASTAGSVEEVGWTAPDGLAIQGLLVRPRTGGPSPLIVSVHGGPISSVCNRWLGSSMVPLLLSRGYAVLMPNPRGSAGRGQEFARRVLGDVGGAETGDHLSGIEALVERGIVDGRRVGVTGGSHGGFMTSWLVTQTDRFAAAVAIAPVTDWYSQHGTSNIGDFDSFFLQDKPSRPGRYFDRSPVMFAEGVRTPTFVVAGGRDRCTPPGQAIEMYRALREAGVDAQLAIYPEEGHGVRHFPAAIDLAARTVDWFSRYMPATPERSAARDESEPVRGPVPVQG